MTPAERKALLYLAALAAIGTVVRVAGGGRDPSAGPPTTIEHMALDRQLAVVDSAQAAKERGVKTRRPRGTGRPRARRSPDTQAPPPPASGAGPAPPLTPRRPRADTPARTSPAGPVDVDRADAGALEQLPGIGPALARRIVADRTARGPFGSIAQLGRVRGIGPRLEERLRPLVTFSGQPWDQRPPP